MRSGQVQTHDLSTACMSLQGALLAVYLQVQAAWNVPAAWLPGAAKTGPSRLRPRPELPSSEDLNVGSAAGCLALNDSLSACTQVLRVLRFAGLVLS